MSPDAVAQYLQHNPKFFEEYADLMAQIFVPHPHGGRAISLPERQMLTLREKVRSLEHTLADLVETGHSNDSLSSKMHRLTIALLAAVAQSPQQVLGIMNYHLREDFAIPHTAFRAWGVVPAHAALDDGERVSAALKRLAAGADGGPKLPYCGPVQGLVADGAALGAEVAGWFGDAGPHLRSLALMPVRGHGGGGLLALASEDEHRFYSGMGTLYLERLAESLSAALTHLFAPQ
ncbi:MAG: DUF484 family protein [Burkholderiales bacterium]|nr:DUF484 family protein [Burkholderiales bacterium]